MCVCLLSIASISFAGAPDPSNPALWQYRTLMSSMTGVTSATIDIIGAANATPTVGHTAVLRSYCILSVGAGADEVFTISQTTKTYAAGAVSPSTFNNPSVLNWAGGAPAISTSTPNFAPSGISICDEPTEYPINPIFNFTTLQPAATTYLWVTYGVPR